MNRTIVKINGEDVVRVINTDRDHISYYYIPKGLCKLTRIVNGKEVTIYS